MVKRKTAAPQRLGEERRSELTWDMNTSEVDNGYTEHECETPSKKVCKKNVKQCGLVDKCLESMVSKCSFYIGIKKDSHFMKTSTAIYLGSVILPIEETCDRLPEDGEFWMYINEDTPRSFLYIESATGVEYHFVNGALNYELFEGLALRCFTLMLEDTNSFHRTHSLNIRVFLNESFCRPCTAHLDIKPRNNAQSFQVVFSYFYGIEPPVFERNRDIKKHDVDVLYKAVKEYHSKNISDKPFVQHPSLVPTLRPYQSQAVQWMLSRESTLSTVNRPSDKLHILYDEIVTPEHRILYYNKYSGYITLEKPVALELPTGGILADEMGLGKTVEVLACMLANPRSEEEIKEETEKRARRSVKEEVCKTSGNSNGNNTVITEHEKPLKTESEINVNSSEVVISSEQHTISTENTSEVLSEVSIDCEVAANVQISAVGESSQDTESSLFSQSIKRLEESTQKDCEIVARVEEINTEIISHKETASDSFNELSVEIKKEKEQLNTFGKQLRRNNRRKPREVSVKCTDSVMDTIERVISKFCYNGKRFGDPKVKRKSEVRTALERWYTDMLSSMKPVKRQSIKRDMGPTFECVCGFGDDFERETVCCSGCSSWQHTACVGFVQEDRDSMTHCYFCPRCWQSQDPVASGGTLIVSPASISNQWINEIKKHIKEENLSILVYKGMHKHGFFQPEALAKYHIVITTYETLRRELNYADLNGTDGRRLRHAKRFLAPPSPLPCVQWWRLCLDEAQMVEGTNRTAEMARRLAAVHRWAITGTPVQKSIHDLFGLVQFLDIDPYNDLRWWQDLIYYPYTHGNPDPLYKLMGDIMWRTAKKDVLDQINIPEQAEVVEWLNFSPVEEHFYRRQHQECSANFIAGLSKMKSLDITLDSLHRHTISKILAPLLKLRQACSHPQAVRGKFITSAKATMSMEELLESLIKKTKNESEEALRQNIAALNGLAGINIIKENWSEAVEIYREVLRIADQYKDKLKVDKLQMIHTLHNLADILEAKYAGIPPTLHDDTLREDAIELEKKYMLKINSQLTSQQETLAGLSVAVTELENGFQIGRDIWWVELLSWLLKHGEEAELISKIRDDLEEKKLPGQESVKNRLTRIITLECELSKWDDLVPKFRAKCVKNLRALEATAHQDLVNGAVDCHLRLSIINSKNKKKCKLCACESELKKYESLIFAVSKKETEHSMVGNVLVLGQLNQGTWKPSEMERALRVVVAFGRTKRANKDLLDDGNHHLKLLDAMKKEFRQLRLVWAHLRDQVSAQDELNMAKLRLRIRYPDEPVLQKNQQKNPLHQLSSNVGNAVETIHIIERHQVNAHAARMDSDKVVAQGELRRKTGQLLYLENLRKSRGLNSNPDPCPVCQTNLGDKWCVLQCGHCYCLECIRFLIEQNKTARRLSVKCPVCRDSTAGEDLSYVNLRCKASNAKEEDVEGIAVKGSHSTKVEAVVYRLLALRAADPKVKALVFSTWEKVLDVLAFALKENDITFSRLQPGVNYQENLQNFKDIRKDITALLLPVRWGAKGLNLIEATHVLLVEPILNPADELQAIGRVHRIGQTRKTVIHRFLIRGTVEERMYTAVRSSGVEKWSGDRVTLRQLQDLFTATYKDPDETVEDNNTSSTSDDAHDAPSSSYMPDNGRMN